tara:strand:+ start:323 stop:637 length:315 start_codon:yes stop_codon:yes gene_type:complete
MDYDIITEIELLLQDYLGQGEKIHLWQVLAGVDLIYKLIPNLEELNEAINGVGGIKINRSRDFIEIHSMGQKESDYFTKKDLVIAMNNYTQQFNKSIKNKHNKT